MVPPGYQRGAFMGWKSWSAAAAVAASALGFALSAQGQGRPMIILYEHVFFKGRDQALYDDVRNLREFRFNDGASSIRVISGVWEVCGDADFQGRCVTVRGNEPDLTQMQFNDQISSVRLLSGGGGRRRDRGRGFGDRGGFGGQAFGSRGFGGREGSITLYEHVFFRGETRRIDGGSSNLQNERFNDTVSSVRVGGGNWQLCEHSDFRGRCITVDHDIDDLSAIGFNDQISSVRQLR
jgi:hypothetical protein